MLLTIHGTARLASDPELRFTPAGKPVCNFRIAASESKRLPDGGWEDGDKFFANVALWGADAEQAAEDLRKGDLVTLAGRIYLREYEASDGGKRQAVEIKFATVGKVVKGRRDQQQGYGQQAQTRQALPANDPWAAPAAQQAPDEPPF